MWRYGAPKTFATPLERSLDLGGGVQMPFCACPAGSFKMMDHKVTITRPFWISKTVVSLNQLTALPNWKSWVHRSSAEKFKKQFSNRFSTCAVGPSSAQRYIDALMQKYRGVLPPKYVFRLPTEAELHYAYWAGADDMSTDSTVIDDIVTTTGEALAELGLVPKVNVWNWKNYPREYSGLYLATLPNANEFGVVPWVAGYRELWILDTVKCMDLRDSLVSRRNQIKEIMNYADEEIDPLRTGDHYVGVRGDRDHSKVRFVKEFADNFLIVIGPDLESEKKAAGK